MWGRLQSDPTAVRNISNTPVMFIDPSGEIAGFAILGIALLTGFIISTNTGCKQTNKTPATSKPATTSTTKSKTTTATTPSTTKPATPSITKTLNSWLNLYNMQTVSGGRTVSIPGDATKSKWAMREGLTKINIYANREIAGRNTVKTGAQGQLTDKDGRYWVAVGPKVLKTNYPNNGKCNADDFKADWGRKLDAVIKDKSGKLYYVPCVVGDIKAHTYPNGIYQTGYKYPNGTECAKNNVDGSIIEFCGKGSLSGFTEYTIEKIIVY
mgnify:CR=1 FL=1